MRIGVLGGTFDPIHVGHLIIAESVREEAGLDEIWFMPAFRPPHKAGEKVTDAALRMEMVKAAIAGNPRFRASGLEFELGGPSYTVETVRALADRYPDDRFYWIIGGDMIAWLPNFHRVEELAERIGFIGVKRPGYENGIDRLPDRLRKAVTMADAPLIDVSSADIRRRLGDGRSVRYLVPDPVISLIREKGLYGSGAIDG
jgi:nicotinate-nucleotide adenylyltransferase